MLSFVRLPRRSARALLVALEVVIVGCGTVAAAALPAGQPVVARYALRTSATEPATILLEVECINTGEAVVEAVAIVVPLPPHLALIGEEGRVGGALEFSNDGGRTFHPLEAACSEDRGAATAIRWRSRSALAPGQSGRFVVRTVPRIRLR